MIKKKAELPTETLFNFKGGDGSVTMEHFMDQKLANGMGRLFVKGTLSPGASVGLHKHDGDCELYYILEGEALVTDNGSEVVLGPGDVHFCPDGSSHALANSSPDNNLSYIAIILFTKQKES